jgi:hypothetical protein
MNLCNRLVLGAIALSPYVGDARRRHTAWEQRFAATSPPAVDLTAPEPASPRGVLDS